MLCGEGLSIFLFLFDSRWTAYLVPAGNFLDAGESEDQAYNKDNEECAEEPGIGTGGIIHDICSWGYRHLPQRSQRWSVWR